MTYVALALVFLGSGVAAWAAPRARASIADLAGFGLLYTGQRMFGADPLGVPISAAGCLLIIGGLLLRSLESNTLTGANREAQQAALKAQIVSVLSLLFYALTQDAVIAGLGLGDEAAERWRAVWSALWPIVWLLGTLPMLFLDLMLAQHPRAVPPGATAHGVRSGLAVALALSLVFPMNYVASAQDIEWDFSYFRVTRPGSSTQALVNNLEKPVEVLLFYPSNSEVKEKMLPYFDDLSEGSGGKLTVRVVDQPMEPKLSEELSVRDNGFVVLRQEKDAPPAKEGAPDDKAPEKAWSNEKFKLDADLKKAKKDLKKLDETFQKSLLKLAKGKRVAYLTIGHGEAGPRDEDPLYKLAEFKSYLRSQNYEVNDFGLDQGSTSAVPEDAALVVVAAPAKSFLPEEVDVLNRYVDGGGHLLIFADPGRDPMQGLLSHLGLTAGASKLGHNSKFIPSTRGPADRYNIFSQRFGTHASVSTLSKMASKAGVVFIGAAALTESGQSAAPAPVKLTPLIRSNEDTWEDLNGNMQQDPDEPGKVHVVAYAAQGPDTAPYRVVVVGDVSLASDVIVQQIQGPGQFLADAARWLIGDEDLVGETQSEEDVQIEHTREDDVAWFYGTIFGVPLLVLAAGALFLRRRAA